MCAGRIASAVGKNDFPQMGLKVFTDFGLECLKSNDKYELKETAFTYFSDLSVSMKDEIEPIFEPVINTILATMNEEDKHQEVKDESQKDASKGFSLDSDSEADLVGIEVNLNQVDERCAAINALGIIAIHAPRLVQSRMKEILDSLEKLQ